MDYPAMPLAPVACTFTFRVWLTYLEQWKFDCAVALLVKTGRAAAVQPPHTVPDESLGGAAAPRLTPSEQMSHEEFLRWALHGGQPHECGYGRNCMFRGTLAEFSKPP
ncbi:MAG: hypothetical protein ACLUZQ_07710 [Butyricicoccus sp.]